MVKLVEGASLNCMIELSNLPGCYFQFSAQTYFPLQGKDKFPLDEGDIFESKFPLVARIGLAARACGSGIGQSPSNSEELFHNNLKSQKSSLYLKPDHKLPWTIIALLYFPSVCLFKNFGKNYVQKIVNFSGKQ